MSSTNSASSFEATPNWKGRVFSSPWAYVAAGVVILWADLLTGSRLMFPILFVAPVMLCAWRSSAKVACALAILLPLGRVAITMLVEDQNFPTGFAIANTCIRIGVLLLLAVLAARTARLSRKLEERVAGYVRMCAWSRTVEFEGEWLSFEEYLKRRFNLDTTHGVSPSAVDQVREKFRSESKAAKQSVDPSSH